MREPFTVYLNDNEMDTVILALALLGMKTPNEETVYNRDNVARAGRLARVLEAQVREVSNA